MPNFIAVGVFTCRKGVEVGLLGLVLISPNIPQHTRFYGMKAVSPCCVGYMKQPPPKSAHIRHATLILHDWNSLYACYHSLTTKHAQCLGAISHMVTYWCLMVNQPPPPNTWQMMIF